MNSNSETKVKTPYINKNSNDKLYNVNHNYTQRNEPNTTCYIWPGKQQTRNCLKMRIGIEDVNSKKKFKSIKIVGKSLLDVTFDLVTNSKTQFMKSIISLDI